MASNRMQMMMTAMMTPLSSSGGKKHKDKHRFIRCHDRDYSCMKSELDAGWGRASCAAFSSGVAMATGESVSHKVRGENSCSIIQVT